MSMTYRKSDHLELGVEWDDFVDESLVLYDVIVMGYPSYPHSVSDPCYHTRTGKCGH